jgi:hypothetical protein
MILGHISRDNFGTGPKGPELKANRQTDISKQLISKGKPY